MILEDKGVLDSTMLKIVAKILRENPPRQKGFKVKTLEGTAVVTQQDILYFVSALADEVQKGNYEQLKKCETCGNFGYPGRKGEKGWCSPKTPTSFRKVNDHCSQWIPMTKEQEYTRRKLRGELGTLQTKRAGNGSKDS